jgi:hypothetical protein
MAWYSNPKGHDGYAASMWEREITQNSMEPPGENRSHLAFTAVCS